ncbi:uncharacterized protein LOC119615864 [Lucilia sericata]|uniref:uncharacterized protein LOC119599841 n=1 Tax=Lucilia sericata TaxID=13632 RepID=UPI0018A8756D|nr:uncharacterized protein LOC119599841 [Lucilia sericata]XP_037827776.1 uncharacterized protein LOC119615864 [Lucilia sericata]
MLNEPGGDLSREDQLSLLRKELRKNIFEAYATNRDKYNLRTRPISFSVGQEVFRRNFAQSSMGKNFNAKLAPLFLKAKVSAKVGNNYYVLQDLEGKKLGTFHAKDIRP